MPNYQDRYDRPAQAYEERLQAASLGEEELAEDLWKRTRAETEAQHAQQTNRAFADIAGAGSQGGPERLRAATYGAGQVGQQYATDAAMLAALEDQAYREQMMQVLGRRGEYGMQGMGFAAEQYAAAAQQQAYEKTLEEQRKLREAQEAAETLGIVMGMMGAGLGGAG
jgi:hypothetical protein